MLPDRSIWIGQKLVENAIIEKFKWDILSDFLTMCEASMNRNANFWPQVFARGTYLYVKDELVKLEQVSIETFLWTSRAPSVESIGQPPGFIVNFFLLCPFADMTWCMGFQKTATRVIAQEGRWLFTLFEKCLISIFPLKKWLSLFCQIFEFSR